MVNRTIAIGNTVEIRIVRHVTGRGEYQMRQNVGHVTGHGAHLMAGWDVTKFLRSVQKKAKKSAYGIVTLLSHQCTLLRH
jgi:hypothetical protein